LQRHASAAKLLVIERVLPERIDPDDPRCRANVLTDVNMMLMSPGGRERTEVEHRQLLMQAGLQIERIVPTPSPLAIIQATPAPTCQPLQWRRVAGLNR
jgi:hypothetical protein